MTRFDPETFEVEVRSGAIRSYFHDTVLDPATGSVRVSAVRHLLLALGPASSGRRHALFQRGQNLI